ncbi:hypothetical protein YYC_02386 [Plasmodium yoelii 17X]|uniref:Yir1 protein n=2 Tax=Plasmodium yoelii TaxID=5861 RepID=Q7R7R7_PLAYO|nr:putative yir1 protein [Plasmodium yoelii yoelii]ETB59993.1 hypothetical protein YYC_02386 [Plasmodium yoelii 17X]
MPSKVVYILFIILFCDVFNVINKAIVFDQNSQNYTLNGQLINGYCPNLNCDNDDKKVSSAFITLLTLFNGIPDKETLESDKLAEYAILWLSYILNQKTQNGTITLNDFYTEHIEKHSNYNKKTTDGNDTKINKEVIDKKKDLMNMKINIISNFYDAFKSLCNMHSEIGEENYQCNKCLKNAGDFFEKYEQLQNYSDITEKGSYSQLFSSLSNDYEKF